MFNRTLSMYALGSFVEESLNYCDWPEKMTNCIKQALKQPNSARQTLKPVWTLAVFFDYVVKLAMVMMYSLISFCVLKLECHYLWLGTHSNIQPKKGS